MQRDGDPRAIPLAIVGLGCRLPGADDLDQYWKMLIEGRCAVADLPPERLDAELYFDPKKGVRHKTSTRRGAIPSSRQFDHGRCPIDPALVRLADPTHLVMCQVAADALRHAGMDPLALPLRNTGVYVGHTIGSERDADEACAFQMDEAAELLREVPAFCTLPAAQQEVVLREWVQGVRGRLGAKDGPQDLASHMAAGIIAKGFGLTGPFVAVNAACASSLQALLLAARALQRGTIDMAIVGGASVCGSEWLVLFSAAQSMSATQSRPFDHRADGLIVAEGYVAVVLKTLARAVADGDPIQAVIRGVGVSSDGKGRSLWAPRREGQVAAIRRAYEAGPALADLQYIEAHSTATQLGDATEVASLTEVLADVVPPGEKLPVTSAKANLGHALEAAGLASLAKVVLSMQHGAIPPAVNVERLNPSIDWQKAPVYVPLTAIPWPTPAAGKPRTAGVNAFGIGGLNIHVALEAYDATRPRPAAVPAVARDPDDQAVAVIGRGCVFPGAQGVGAFWELLQSGRDARRSMGNGHATSLCGTVGEFHYDWRRHKIPPKQIESADPLQFMALESADQALVDAGYDQRAFDRSRTGVVVGTEFVGDFTYRLKLLLRLPQLGCWLREILAERGVMPENAAAIEQTLGELLHARWPVLDDESGSFSASSSAVRIAKTWNLMGGAAALDSGPTSGMAALSAAVDQLLCGDCTMMLCVAAQRNLNRRACATLRQQGLLSGDPSRGPFDRNGSGCVPGEGVGTLLLKRLCNARRDGDPVLAVLRGLGVAHDEDAHSLHESLARALADAGMKPSELAAAMTDAAGLPRRDEALLRAVLSLDATGRQSPLRIGSVVGQIGHTGGASAGASLLATTLAVQKQTMPGVVGLQMPLATVVRNAAAVECESRAARLTPASPQGRLAAAVLSHGKGLAWSAIVEQGSVVAAELPGEPVSDEPASEEPATMPSTAIAHRSVLQVVEAPNAGRVNSRFEPHGAVAILGANAASVALERRLVAQGTIVYRLTPSAEVETLLAALEQLPEEPPIRAMLVMTGLDAEGSQILDAAGWSRRRRLGVELPYLVVQRWGQLLERRRVAGPFVLAAATLLGGDLGVTRPVAVPEGGWISGLLKAVHLEWNRYERPTRVKVCDFALSDTPDAVAEAMLRELASEEPEVEVGLGDGRRRLVRAVTEPVARLPRRDVPRGATWVVTGGARGITAEVALKLGQDFGFDLHLLGRSPAPREDAVWRGASGEQLKQIKRSIVRQAISEGKSPEKQWERVKNDIEIDKNLQRMRRLGLRVTYHACDVSDWIRLAEVLETVRRASGPITGIIHGAGYARTGRLESQKLHELNASIGAKVDGALGLMQLTRKDPLRYFVGFGSISGRYGGNGLSDYAAGNDMLAKLCAWFRTVRPECATTCMQWQSWDAVGMAMLPDSNVGAREVLGMQFLPPEEGVEHLKQELSVGLPAREVLIDDGQFERLLGKPVSTAADAIAGKR